MSRRFNDEPINLIRRIPSPEQLSAARPTKPSFGQKLIETGAAFARSAMELFASPARQEPSATVPAETAMPSADPVEHDPSDSRFAGELNGDPILPHQAQVVMPFARQATGLVPPAKPVGHQVEEVAELRAYLLSQQQDIARLAEQVQELKSLVASQRQVLVYLGRELETNSQSRMTGSIASAVAKPERPVRQKVVVKTSEIKEKAVAQDKNPMPSSLNL